MKTAAFLAAAALASLALVVVSWKVNDGGITPKHPRRVLIEKLLAKYANDPGSVSIQKVLYGPIKTEKDGSIKQLVHVEYREKNESGAMQFKETFFDITELPGEPMKIQTSWLENSPAKPSALEGDKWSIDPAGPTPKSPPGR